MERKKLCDAIGHELDARQLSRGMFADRLGVSSATLRTWLHRNCFPREAIRMIGNAFNWQISEDELKSQYEFSLARPMRSSILYQASTLRAALITADRERERIAAAMAPMVKTVVNLCSKMGEHDLLFTLTATVTPWEMERHVGKEMREAVIEGVRRGGTYVYLRPRQDLIDNYDNYQFDRIPNEAKCRDEILEFRKLVEDRLKENGVPEADAAERVNRSLLQYHVCDDLPFLAPGFVFMMFRAGEGYGGTEEDRLVVRLPDNTWAIVYFTKSVYFHDRFRRTVHKALQDELKRLQAEGEKIDVNRELRREALKAAKAELAREQEIVIKIINRMST